MVLAFCLCKCFALMPALMLMQSQYNTKTSQQVMLAVHYIVLFGFALFDLLHIVIGKLFEVKLDVFKLFLMLVYTCCIFFTMVAVDTGS